MYSCIYEGTIRHRRYRPRANMFQYRLFFMFLDLAELPTLFDIHPLWSNERFNIACFRRRDHFGDPEIPLDQAVQDLVEERLGNRPNGPIRLLTHLRYFGHCFNPASFYYCYDPTDTRVDTIVVEIHNTPWGERYCYVLGAEHNEHPITNWRRHQFAKAFHVSPFIEIDIHYDWRFRLPDDAIRVHMIDYEKGEKLFDASLALQRREITRRTLTRVLIRYPVMTGKVVTMIYWQALRLILKRTPFFAHPNKREPSGERALK
ncbi:MAG: DUF1365 domain-containing protein [Desulfobacterales bacterium]